MLDASMASLKNNSRSALISTPAELAAGTLLRTTGGASSRRRSPRSRTCPLAVRAPTVAAIPFTAGNEASILKVPTVTGAKRKRPSGPTRATKVPAALLAEVKWIMTSPSAPGVVPSARTSRPAMVPLAVRVRSLVTVSPGVVRVTAAWAPSAWEKADRVRVPTGRLLKLKAP